MNNTLINLCGSAQETYTLKISRCNDLVLQQKRSMSVSDRFLQTAGLLAEDGFFALQMNPAELKKGGLCVFPSVSGCIMSEDYDWIFENYAKVPREASGAVSASGTASTPGAVSSPDVVSAPGVVSTSELVSASVDDLFAGNRHVYVLSRKTEAEGTISEDNFRAAFDFLTEENACIRIVACNNVGGVVLISLPDRIPLRLRGALALSFPGMELVELQPAALSQSVVHSDAHSKAQPSAQSEVRPETQSETQPDARPEIQPETQTDARSEAQYETQPGARSETQSETQPEAQPNFWVPLSEITTLFLRHLLMLRTSISAETREGANGCLDRNGSNPLTEQTLLEQMNLGVVSFNILKRAGITTLGELEKLSDEDLLQIRGMRMKTLAEIRNIIDRCEDPDVWQMLMQKPGTGTAPESGRGSGQGTSRGSGHESGRRSGHESGCGSGHESGRGNGQGTSSGSAAEPGSNLPAVPKSPSDMLDEMIGLKNVKEQVRRIVAFSRMKRDMESRGKESVPVVLNMEFVGNPGTAKTSIARILAGLLKEAGILTSDELIEVGRADLVAKYQGQTAAKVKETFEKAKGKLLFIDEAYSLFEDDGGHYGIEAVDTIVQEMENRRNETIVIFAGYPDEMAKFFAMNPGLRSRVPFRIAFEDYSMDELTQIAGLEAEKRGFTIDADAAEQLNIICKTAAGRPEMGNGRFCRNMVENAVLNYAARVYGTDGDPTAVEFVLTARDFSVAYVQSPGTKPRIGFCG